MTGDAKPGAIVKSRTYDDANGRKRLSLATRSDLAIEAQVSASGATWLDRQLLARESALGSSGFGAEVREAMDRRIDHLVEQDLARRQGQRVVFARDLLGTPRQRRRGRRVAARDVASVPDGRLGVREAALRRAFHNALVTAMSPRSDCQTGPAPTATGRNPDSKRI
jgi:hypothetical protein